MQRGATGAHNLRTPHPQTAAQELHGRKQPIGRIPFAYGAYQSVSWRSLSGSIRLDKAEVKRTEHRDWPQPAKPADGIITIIVAARVNGIAPSRVNDVGVRAARLAAPRDAKGG